MCSDRMTGQDKISPRFQPNQFSFPLKGHIFGPNKVNKISHQICVQMLKNARDFFKISYLTFLWITTWYKATKVINLNFIDMKIKWTLLRIGFIASWSKRKKYRQYFWKGDSNLGLIIMTHKIGGKQLYTGKFGTDSIQEIFKNCLFLFYWMHIPFSSSSFSYPLQILDRCAQTSKVFLWEG